MFGHQYIRFLCIVEAASHASAFQLTLLAQVEVSGSASHYRSLDTHHNIDDERLVDLGIVSTTRLSLNYGA